MFSVAICHLTDLVIGVWRVASIVRRTRAYLFSLSEGGFTTDWEIAVLASRQKLKAKRSTTGNVPNAFGTGRSHADHWIDYDRGPSGRLPYPGETGQRNNFRRGGSGIDRCQLDRSRFKLLRVHLFAYLGGVSRQQIRYDSAAPQPDHEPSQL